LRSSEKIGLMLLVVFTVAALSIASKAFAP
jgi:hypothetical protein